jgi:uncharacterized protein (TIGR00730 family)
MEKRPFERICVFCGSSVGLRKQYEDAAISMARELAQREIDLTYGGGSVGLMGVIADEMLRLGREVIGIIPQAIASREVAHHYLTELRVVRSMHERKSLMAELSDAFIALPGGYGTYEELFEVITWAQLGIHQKPIGILNVAGYFDPMLELVERGIEEEFIRPQYRDLIVVSENPEELLNRMESFEPVEGLTKWIDLVKS